MISFSLIFDGSVTRFPRIQNNTVREKRALSLSPGLGQDRIVSVNTRGKLRLRNAL